MLSLSLPPAAGAAGTLGEEWFQVKRMTKSGQEINANFGSAVAVSGNWAIVGARGDDNGSVRDTGSVEFWERSIINRNWVRRSILLPPNPTATDLLGEDVDIEGNWAVASAIGADVGGNQFAGAPVVYRRSGSSWVIDAALPDPDGSAEFMGYGDVVALDGDTIAVGYRSAAGGGQFRGKVDIFRLISGTWVFQQTILGTVDGGMIPDDLELEGDTLVIGAQRANNEVKIYQRAAGVFTEVQTLTAQGVSPPAAFGLEVALNQERLAALAADRIEVFQRDVGGIWQPLQSIDVPGLELGIGIFGEQLALTPDRIHVILDGTGLVPTYRFDGSTFQFEQEITTPTVAMSLGATDPNILLVGHPTESSSRGVVDALEYVPSTATAITSITASPSQAGQGVSITVNVTADSVTPTGFVNVTRVNVGTGGSAFACFTVQLVNGQANCTTSFPAGDFELFAEYKPDLGFAASTSDTVQHMVLRTPTTTTILADNPDPSVTGQSVVVEYSVAASEPTPEGPQGEPAGPTGTVTVSDGATNCSGSVAAGSCTLIFNTPGTRNLVASYSGDTGFAPSDSPAVSHEVLVANQPPVANDDAATTNEDAATTIDVAANDTDSDGNLEPTTTNTACGTCSAPGNGLLANNGNGTFDYTPDADYFGPDAFVYEICDTDGACDTATVNIEVQPVNDAPSFVPGANPQFPAGTTGAQNLPGWVVSVDFGGGESQNVNGYSVNIVDDAAPILTGTPTIAPDGSLSFSLTGASGTAQLTASVTDDGGTANGGIDTSTPVGFTITVESPSADLSIGILRCTPKAAPGAPYPYGLLVVNNGPDAAEGVAVTHTQIPGATVNAISSLACVDMGDTIDCDLGTVSIGVNIVIGIDIQAPNVVAQTLTMSATVVADTGDPFPGGNTDQTTVEIVPGLVAADGFESCGPINDLP